MFFNATIARQTGSEVLEMDKKTYVRTNHNIVLATKYCPSWIMFMIVKSPFLHVQSHVELKKVQEKEGKSGMGSVSLFIATFKLFLC